MIATCVYVKSMKPSTKWHIDMNTNTQLRTTLWSRPLVGLVVVIIWGIVGLVACTADPSATVCANACIDPSLELFYEENGGEDVFGLPYTPLFEDPTSERMVQYFERARLEYDPATPDDILIAALGAWALDGLDAPIPATVPATGPSRLFETGYTVQDQFLTFYEANKGELLFGQPLSPQLDEGELRVQYFENARLEWHPEAPPERQIQVGLLGRAHYLYEVYNPIANVFIPDDQLRVTAAEVTAAVSSPILYAGDQQILYVIVESRDRQPIPGVQVELEITQGALSYTQELEGATNDLGTLQSILELPELTLGEEVRLTVFIRYPGETNVIGKTSIPFKPWW